MNKRKVYISKISKSVKQSQGATKYIYNTNEWGRIPFNSDGTINLVIPIAWAREVETTISFLHDDTVGDEFEIFIDIGDGFENLYLWYIYIITYLISP